VSSLFPSGRFGLGLLALRLALAVHVGAAAVLAVSTLRSGSLLDRGSTWIWSATLLVCTALNAIGFLSLITQVVIAMTLLVGWAGLAPVPDTLEPLASWSVETLQMAVPVALALLGPGAYSVDARLFGWRQVTIASLRDRK
jgi:uncharacterized membrane protein YphA (DoxX/SURF4 family)